jgi:glycerophosphoryl diester phosphodiesterase
MRKEVLIDHPWSLNSASLNLKSGISIIRSNSEGGVMLVIGHRGGRAVAPENTLKAIRIGITCSDYVEVDIRLSRDSIPIVMHDAIVDRTTNGRGPIRELNLSELKLLDAGEGEEIPTLEEVCRAVRGRCGLFAEIKEPGSEEIVCQTLRESGLDDLYIVSFHAESLMEVKRLLPLTKTGWIFSKETPPPAAVRNLGADAVLPKFAIISPGLVRSYHQSGITVFTWTLNTPDEFRTAGRCGIDGVATDDPCRARDFIKKEERSES